MSYFVPALALVFGGLFAIRTFSTSPLMRPQSRLDLVFDGLDAAVVLIAAHALTPWAQVGAPWWLLLVAPLAVGAAGAVLRWSELPMLRAGRGRVRTLVFAGIHALILILLLALFFA